MKMTSTQLESLARRVITGLEKKNLITFSNSRDEAVRKARETLESDYRREADLESDVHKMLDDIEREQTDQFERHRMFKMLKKKVAEERGVIL